MKRFLFSSIGPNGEEINVSLYCVDGQIRITSETGEEPNTFHTPIPPITSEQSRMIAMALIEIAAEADSQIAAEICDL